MEDPKNIQQWTNDLTRMDLYAKIQLVGKDVEYIKEAIKRLEKVNDSEGEKYVTKEEFNAKFAPVKSITYGLVGIILSAVVIALVSVVIIRQ